MGVILLTISCGVLSICVIVLSVLLRQKQNNQYGIFGTIEDCKKKGYSDEKIKLFVNRLCDLYAMLSPDRIKSMVQKVKALPTHILLDEEKFNKAMKQ